MSKTKRALKRLHAERTTIEQRLTAYREGGPIYGVYAAKLRAIDAKIAALGEAE